MSYLLWCLLGPYLAGIVLVVVSTVAKREDYESLRSSQQQCPGRRAA